MPAFPLLEPAKAAIKAAVQASNFDVSSKQLHDALTAAGCRWRSGAGNKSEGTKKDTTEQDETMALAFRVVLEELVVNSNRNETGGGAIQDSKVVALLDLALHAAHLGWVPKQLPFMCVHELFEGQTARRCGDAFVYLEQRVDKLKDLLDDTNGDSKFVQAALLRCWNTLMQRLSKSTDLLLCGRVLMFLSHVLPLSEKSGVNLKGEFNKGNVTEYEEELHGEEAERMQAEGTSEKTFKLRSTDEKLDGQMEVFKAFILSCRRGLWTHTHACRSPFISTRRFGGYRSTSTIHPTSSVPVHLPLEQVCAGTGVPAHIALRTANQPTTVAARPARFRPSSACLWVTRFDLFFMLRMSLLSSRDCAANSSHGASTLQSQGIDTRRASE